MQNTYNRSSAIRTGLIAGLIIGLISALPSLLLDAPSLVALSTPITAVSCIVTLVTGLLIGYLGARNSGATQESRVRAGLIAGLMAGLVMGLISMAAALIQNAQGVTKQILDLTYQQQIAAAPESQRAAMTQALSQTRAMTETITQIGAFVAPVFSMLIHMALGALGSLFLRKPNP